ncbi:MAG: DUF2062 domain-containing protein [Rhodomicrobium sp.]|nr:DUF2062 domain-containing protein [Rhodomicrobium sp.]
MLFKRRKQLSPVQRLRLAVWPARSFGRSSRYMLLRLWRIRASSHSVALGCAAGVFAIFTPFLGFQMMLAALLAWVFRGNVLASAVGTFAGNPLTYPVIWISTFTVGNLFLGSSPNAEMSRLSSGAQALGRSLREASPDGVASAVQGLWPVLKPMAVGSLPLGGLTAVLIYFIMRHLLDARKGRRFDKAGAKPAAAPAR